jgi:hypothetical protein
MEAHCGSALGLVLLASLWDYRRLPAAGQCANSHADRRGRWVIVL